MDGNTTPVALNTIELAAEIVSAYISNNSVPAADLPALIGSVHAALNGLSDAPTAAAPAVDKVSPSQIRKSISAEALISFEDGKPYKTLRRHLTLRGLTPETYREKWGLPRDYPMTAATYSAQRSELARTLGLGQRRRKAGTAVVDAAAVAAADVAAADVAVEAAAPAKPRGRKKVAAAATE